MAEAADFLHAVKLSGFFFKPPLKEHNFVPVNIDFFTKISVHRSLSLGSEDKSQSVF
jgi:hypothetical protein